MKYDKYKDIFISEANEHLDLLDANLIKLEKLPGDQAVIKELMRHAHTLKGISATAGFGEISNLTHSLEGMLENLKNGIATGGVQILFGAVDELKDMISHIDQEEESAANPLTDELGELEVKDIDVDKSVVKNPESLSTIKELKIRAEKIDKIMEITSELLLNKMALEAKELLSIGSAVEKNSALVQELQYQVLQLRLIPVSQIFNRFPRMVRDLSKNLNKEIDFQISGADIELDREVLDGIGEPLVHLLRNAVDHGIEKSGSIILSAKREKNYAVIEVKDTGKGINWDKLKQKAGGKKITFNNQEDLLFSGLSTSDTVNEISGRGVGMYTVKEKIEQLGGRVEFDTGESGTIFKLLVPVSLAIIKGLVVNVDNQRYVVPISSIERLIPLREIEVVKQADQDMAIYNDSEVNIIWLNQVFSTKNTKSAYRSGYEVALLTQIKDNFYGFVVDEVIGQQDIVVKSVSQDVRQHIHFSSVTILGDGLPIPIIDLNYLISTN